jgi:anti-sigma regulatory factor (Ser/Thr protein kinase)
MDRQTGHVRLAFANERGAPRQARNAVAAIVPESDPIAPALLLAVSELVTNVIAHTNEGGVLQAWESDGRLRVEVEDRSAVPPAVDGEVDIGGRGLRIVDKVADAWGFSTTPEGKEVWAEFDRPAATRRGSGGMNVGTRRGHPTPASEE